MTDDVIELLIPYLKRKLKPVQVATEVPEDRPDVLVTVNRSGGPQDRLTQTQRVVVDAWERSDYAASALINKAVDAILWSKDEILLIVSAEIDSVYRSDVDGAHRWSATVDIFANRL